MALSVLNCHAKSVNQQEESSLYQQTGNLSKNGEGCRRGYVSLARQTE